MVQQLFANDDDEPFQNNQDLVNSPVPWKLVALKEDSLEILYAPPRVAKDERSSESCNQAKKVLTENLEQTENVVQQVEEVKTEEKTRNLSDDQIVDVMKESTYPLL